MLVIVDPDYQSRNCSGTEPIEPTTKDVMGELAKPEYRTLHLSGSGLGALSIGSSIVPFLMFNLNFLLVFADNDATMSPR